MSDNADYSGLLQDKYKCDLTSLDLFDKVINLKLTTGDGESYVIRSDYETYIPDLMKAVSENNSSFITATKQKKCYIRKCQYKPSIKINYKRVSMSTPIEIDLFINNFFMLDKSGKMLKTFNNLKNPLVKVEVMLGYFGQFQSALLPDKEAGSISIKSLFDFNPDKVSGHGITTIVMSNVVYVQTDKLPPDMTVHIHGFVGNLYSEGLKEVAAQGSSVSFEEKLKNETIINYKSLGYSGTFLDKIFFDSVTKKWLKGSVVLPENFKKEKVNEKTGALKAPMTDDEAKKYGIKVYFSKGAEEFAKEFSKTQEVGNVSVGTESNALAQVNWIKKHFGLDSSLCVTEVSSSGDLLLYRSNEVENMSEILKETTLSAAYKKTPGEMYWDSKLPAVYNITTDALCTIVCPFFFCLNPFQKFYFKSAYALGGLVSYYANFTASEDEFYALWQTISFATIEEVNECTIVCTGKRRGTE